MPDEIQQLKNRLTELADRASGRHTYTYSEFLTLSEQDTLLTMKLNTPHMLCGGYDGAERKLACFGDEELCGYDEAPPIVLLGISPLSQKFADTLTHRDFLGALMSLGVRRGVLGDIILHENCGYLFCLESIADFIVREFVQVKHTAVSCRVLEALPEVAVQTPDITRVNVASERLDAVVAAVYKLSRSDGQTLFTQGKVYVNSRLTENTSRQPDPGDIISIRGFGRFVYEGLERETRKGRLFVNVRVY